ncbi:MAG: hypothetical protein M1813_002980 [Trichoglossum hirsutum]|nr:MAG: hypothetical protein M1813_002980 [Trichoglossum hirsutum]
MDIDSSTDGDGDTTMGGVEDELYPGSTRSKISEVVSNLVKPDQTSTSNTGKHLVFSCWTTTLDHLEDALVARRLQFVRIDGKRSDTQRESAIDSFQSDPGLRVMLLSIGVGSAGLNLTAASHVHIVEPQWNPMVEEQAAARVHRIGQERDVSIIRYIVKDSIEERIRDRQKHKLKVAEGANASQDSIEDIRNASILTEYPASIATQNLLELDFLLLEIPLLQEQLAPY